MVILDLLEYIATEMEREQWDLMVDEPALGAIAAGADALEVTGDRRSAALLRQLVVQAARTGRVDPGQGQELTDWLS